MGTQHKYEKKYDKMAFKLGLLGLTDKAIAEFLNTTESTIGYWKKHYASFSKALRRGKQDADANIAKALYSRAIGYSHPEVHIMPNKIKEYGVNPVTGKTYVTSERMEPMIVPLVKYYPPDSFACLKWLALRQRELWSETKTVNHNINGKIDVNHVKEQLHDIEDYPTEELKMALNLGIREQIAQGNVMSN